MLDLDNSKSLLFLYPNSRTADWETEAEGEEWKQSKNIIGDVQKLAVCFLGMTFSKIVFSRSETHNLKQKQKLSSIASKLF